MIHSPARRRLLSKLVNRIMRIKRPHPTRVGINGIDAAGKSYFADELAEIVGHSRRQVVRASIDGFHNPEALRYRRGVDSPEGFYYDSFNIAKFIDALLSPLGPGGNRRYRTQVFDYRVNTPVISAMRTATKDAVVIIDGIFLFCPELNAYWDYRIYLHVDDDIALERVLEGKPDYTAEDDLIARYHRRYFAGQHIYIEQCHPEQVADAVIDNNVLQKPFFVALR